MVQWCVDQGAWWCNCAFARFPCKPVNCLLQEVAVLSHLAAGQWLVLLIALAVSSAVISVHFLYATCVYVFLDHWATWHFYYVDSLPRSYSKTVQLQWWNGVVIFFSIRSRYIVSFTPCKKKQRREERGNTRICSSHLLFYLSFFMNQTRRKRLKYLTSVFVLFFSLLQIDAVLFCELFLYMVFILYASTLLSYQFTQFTTRLTSSVLITTILRIHFI